MYTAVSHLLYNSPRAPRLLLVNVGHEFIPFGKASFAQVVETLRRANPDDVAVGLLTEDGSMMICPQMRYVHEFGPGDKIILLTRRERRLDASLAPTCASDALSFDSSPLLIFFVTQGLQQNVFVLIPTFHLLTPPGLPLSVVASSPI